MYCVQQQAFRCVMSFWIPWICNVIGLDQIRFCAIGFFVVLRNVYDVMQVYGIVIRL